MSQAEHAQVPPAVTKPGRGRWVYPACGMALFLVVGNLFLHKPLSDLCDQVLYRVGFRIYNRGALITIAGLGLAVAAIVIGRRRQLHAWPALALIALASIAVQQLLLVANIELIHLPQYALLTGVLFIGGLPADLAWIVATLCGVLDEVYQQLVIYANRPEAYLDFNDMILNAVGASWGALLIATRQGPNETVSLRRVWRSGSAMRWGAAALFVSIAIALCALDRPVLHHLWRRAATGRHYHVMPAVEAWLLGVLLWRLICFGAERRAAGKHASDLLRE